MSDADNDALTRRYMRVAGQRDAALARVAELENVATVLAMLLSEARTRVPSSDRGCCETAYIEGWKASVGEALDSVSEGKMVTKPGTQQGGDDMRTAEESSDRAEGKPALPGDRPTDHEKAGHLTANDGPGGTESQKTPPMSRPSEALLEAWEGWGVIGTVGEGSDYVPAGWTIIGSPPGVDGERTCLAVPPRTNEAPPCQYPGCHGSGDAHILDCPNAPRSDNPCPCDHKFSSHEKCGCEFCDAELWGKRPRPDSAEPLKVGDRVSVVGQVTNLDEEDGTVRVKFETLSGGQSSWQSSWLWFDRKKLPPCNRPPAVRPDSAGRCTPDSDWGCEARKKLGIARGVLDEIAYGEGADEQAFDWAEFYASVKRQAKAALAETAMPNQCSETAGHTLATLDQWKKLGNELAALRKVAQAAHDFLSDALVDAARCGGEAEKERALREVKT